MGHPATRGKPGFGLAASRRRIRQLVYRFRSIEPKLKSSIVETRHMSDLLAIIGDVEHRKLVKLTVSEGSCLIPEKIGNWFSASTLHSTQAKPKAPPASPPFILWIELDTVEIQSRSILT